MYLIDTNFLGELENLYPIDVFPSLWQELETRLFNDEVVFHIEVHDEIIAWGSPTTDWYAKNVLGSQILRIDDSSIEHYARVMEWVTEKRTPPYREAALDEFMDKADSYLVAAAVEHSAVIVTNEVRAQNAVKKVKIPDVACNWGIQCIKTVDFMRVLGVSI